MCWKLQAICQTRRKCTIAARLQGVSGKIDFDWGKTLPSPNLNLLLWMDRVPS